MKKDKKSFFTQFREFIMRGNVIDMAIGVIIATAFGKITTSLVGEVVMPAIGYLIGDIDLSNWNIVLKEASAPGAEDAVVIGIGNLLVTIIDFIIIAFIVFMIIKVFEKAKDIADAKLHKQVEEEVAEETTPAPTTEELLADILAELKIQNTKD